jgi:hypothetical protein
MKSFRPILPLLFALPFLARAQTCPVGDLSFPSSRQAALAATDCTLGQAIPDFAGLTQRVVQFRFTLDQARVVRLTMQSLRFDSVILVFGEGYVLRAVRSAVTADGVQRLTVHLPAGTYIAALTSLRAATGTFQLDAVAENLRACPIADLNLGEAADGSLASDGCRVLDLTAYSTDETLLARYRLALPERGAVRFEYGSLEFTPSLRLLGPTGSTLATVVAGEGDAVVFTSLAAGTYTVWANAAGRGFGAYRLTTVFEELRPCRSFPLAPGETAEGAIDPKLDCRVLDIVVPSRNESPVQVYEMEMPRKGILTLDMKSSAFDTYLALAAEEEDYFADNDDFAPATTDSRILTSLQPGPYLIYASHFNGEGGNFTLSAKVEDQRTCEILDIGRDQTVNGRADPTVDCRVLDLVTPSQDATFADFYRLNLTERRVMSLAMRSTEVDAYLILADADGRFLAFNDDGPSGTNSLLSFLMNPGIYHLVASTYSGDEVGAYSVATQSREPVACPIPNLGLSTTLAGALEDGDCRIADTIPLATNPDLVDQYRLTLAQETTINLEVESTAFPAAVFVTDERYRVAAAGARDGAPGTVRLTSKLPAGSHLVLILSGDDRLGAYEIRSSVRADSPVAPSSLSKSAPGSARVREARGSGAPGRMLPAEIRFGRENAIEPRSGPRPAKNPER